MKQDQRQDEIVPVLAFGNRENHHLHIGRRKLKSIFAMFLGFCFWQLLRLVLPELESHPLFIYIYAMIEIRESSKKTKENGKKRIWATLIAIGVGMPFLLLTDLLRKELAAIPEVTVIGTPNRPCGVMSFVVPSIHPFDLGAMLDSQGIAVRTGHLCAQPLVNQLGYDSVIRVSPAFYNTEQEILGFISALKRTIPLLKGEWT